MGKRKGRFRKGKYIQPKLALHIKAKRAKEGPYLALIMRLGVEDVRNVLCPQIERFLKEVEKRERAKHKGD
jgi:hypothetical protein